MTVLDAAALIALLSNEPARSEVESLFRAAEPCRISAINLAETIDVMRRSTKLPRREVERAVQQLELGGLLIEPADAAIAKSAGHLRSEQYRRKDCAVSVADCFALALATTTGERLATADAALISVAVKVGARVVPLPDSTGRRPQV